VNRTADIFRSFPERYDELLVPLLFEPYARVLAQRVSDLSPDDVLEIAAGTGVVTRALSRMLPETVRITATDLNQPMLDRARSHPEIERVRWEQAEAVALPFSEALRVLRPGGRFLFNVWDRREEIPLFETSSEVVGALLAVDPASLSGPTGIVIYGCPLHCKRF
jgi:ubiquinone/menaquinone biosynthesis C-methylase UbiE